MSGKRGEVIEDQQDQFQISSPRYQTQYVEVSNQKEKEKEKEKESPGLRNTGIPPNLDIDEKINSTFNKHDKDYAGLFRACLLAFNTYQPSKILGLIFKNKCDKNLQDDIQRMSDLIKIYRKSSQNSNQSELEVISIINNLLRNQNVENSISNIVRQIIDTKNLLLIKTIEQQTNINQRSKQIIIKTILSNQVIGKYLRPKPARDVLVEKLKEILKALKKGICDPITEQFLTDKNFDFFEQMDQYSNMDDVSLNKGEKILIKTLVSEIPEYKIFVDTSQSDVQVYRHEFIKTILKATTLSNSLSADQLELKYQLINSLIANPSFNIYEYKDKISRHHLQKIITEISQSLFEYIKQTQYVEPLASKKQKDIDSLLDSIATKITKPKYDEFKKYLIEDKYDNFFKDPEVASFVVTLWNKYKALKSCSQAFFKQNQDVALILQSLKWELNLIFTKYEISKKLQDALIENILATGNLLSIEKSDEISKTVCKQLLKEINALESLKGYVKANFDVLSLKQRVKYELTNALINIPVGTGGKQSLDEPLTYKKIMTIIDKLLETKSTNDISTSTFLTINERPIITRQLNKLLTPKAKSVFKEWIYWQGIDLNISFKSLAPDVYQLVRTEQEIDCNVYEKILSQIKNYGDLDFLENISELTEAQKALLKKGLGDNKNLKVYKSELETKNLCIASYNILNEIENQFPDSCDNEDHQLFYSVLVDYLEPRQDLFPLGLKGSQKSLKTLLEIDKIQKAFEKVMKGQDYKIYSQNFPSNFESKEKKSLQKLRIEIGMTLDNINPGKDEKNRKILAFLERQDFNIIKIKNSDQQDVSKTVLNNLQTLDALKDYDSVQFVKVKRVDLISNCSFKKYVQIQVAKYIPLPVRDEIVNLLLQWKISEVIDHDDLSLNDKKKIFGRIARSKEFEKCSNVISNNITTKIPNLTEGILKIINFCLIQNIDIDQDLKKLAKSEFKVKIEEKDVKTYPIKTTYDEFRNQQKIHANVIIKAGTQQVTDKNFGSLTLSNAILNVKLYKKVQLKHKTSARSEELSLGANLYDSIVQKLPSLKDIKFELTDGKNSLNGGVSESTNSIIVQQFVVFNIDGKPVQIKASATFADLKAKVKAAQLEGQNGETFEDIDSLELVGKKIGGTKLKCPKSAVDPAILLKQHTDTFLNWKSRDAADQWGTLKEEQQSFNYAFTKIFQEKNMQGFVKDEFPAIKKIKRGKLRDYLQELEEYKAFAKDAGIVIIISEKKS